MLLLFRFLIAILGSSFRRRVGPFDAATLRFTVLNLANEVALYNFLSTFSGTHFVTPRAYSMSVGVVF
jgi:hypothetical protein